MTSRRNATMRDRRGATSQRQSILLISHTYPPVLGGTEIEAQRVAKKLIERGHRVLVLCAGGAPMPRRGKWVDPMGIPVRILSSKSHGTWAALQFSLGVFWNLLCHYRSFSIVYFLMPGLHLAIGLPTAALLRYRIFMKFSGSNTIRPLARSFAGRWELQFLRRLRVPVMLLNNAMVDEAESVGIPRAQTIFMPNPVDVDVFAPAAKEEKARLRERFGFRGEDFIFIYTGRLSPEKGLKTMLDGFEKAGTRPEMYFVLLGDGIERGALEERVQSTKKLTGRVRFAGRVNPDEVPAWLKAADAFVLVSPNEGFSCALAEAMATGLPSVVSDIAANTQLVRDRIQGLTVGVGDSDSVARAFIRLSEDPEAYQRMSAAARKEIAEKYSTDRIVDMYERLFSDGD